MTGQNKAEIQAATDEQIETMRDALLKVVGDQKTADFLVGRTSVGKTINENGVWMNAKDVSFITNYPGIHAICSANASQGFLATKLTDIRKVAQNFHENGSLSEVEKLKLKLAIHDPAVQKMFVNFAENAPDNAYYNKQKITAKALEELNDICDKSGISRMSAQAKDSPANDLIPVSPTQIAPAAAKSKQSSLA